ncbi:MAG: hypothetical protein WA056_03735 [Gallionella sp.]
MNIKHILFALVFTGISGCASFAPPSPSGHYESVQSARETTNMLLARANQCWATDVTPISRGILIKEQRPADDVYLINVHSVHWSQGIEREPSVVIRIDGKQPTTVVDVVEGDFGCSFFKGCYKIGLTKHVKHWLNGDKQCLEFDNTLVHL